MANGSAPAYFAAMVGAASPTPAAAMGPQPPPFIQPPMMGPAPGAPIAPAMAEAPPPAVPVVPQRIVKKGALRSGSERGRRVWLLALLGAGLVLCLVVLVGLISLWNATRHPNTAATPASASGEEAGARKQSGPRMWVPFACKPECTQIVCDGKPVDLSGAMLTVGQHTCVASNPGKKPVAKIFAVTANRATVEQVFWLDEPH
ncbi:MAG: hypothetical protein JW751_16560 [Polyangiaceae bacterium]|nr:hypothetical protein [Polyangiaceae bacterium]